MKEAFAQRKWNVLNPVSPEDEEIIKQFPEHAILRLQIYGVKKPRSIRQLNMYFACCQTVADNTMDIFWNTKKKADWQVRVALHFVDGETVAVRPDGQISYKYLSIAFKNLPHAEACKFFERAWPIMAAKIGVTEEELLQNASD